MVENERMETTNKKVKKIIKKRKRKTHETVLKTVNVPKIDEVGNNDSMPAKLSMLKQILEPPELKKLKTTEDNERYPILNDEQLVQKLHSVSMTNNQKGRIRQILRDSLKGTSQILLPEVIHNRIQAILKNSATHTDADLRKMRILYNMLKASLKVDTKIVDNKSKKVLKKKEKGNLETDANAKKELKIQNPILEGEGLKKSVKEIVPKIKGPKRYVVFIGNLPLDIDKEKIMQHFTEFKNSIKDVRLPKQREGKKSAIAYVELKDEVSYELALSKHHSMLGNKRINVLYTTQKNGKISKTEAKSKSAKLVALQKSGKLIGSVPMNRKRSHRRTKMKQARAKIATEST